MNEQELRRQHWEKLRSYQHLQNKLFTQLGPTVYGADDTVQSCQLLADMIAEDRPKFIMESWGLLTDEVSFLLDQLARLERAL